MQGGGRVLDFEKPGSSFVSSLICKVYSELFLGLNNKLTQPLRTLPGRPGSPGSLLAPSVSLRDTFDSLLAHFRLPAARFFGSRFYIDRLLIFN